MGSGSMGRLLVMGSERNLGLDRLAQLRSMAAYAAHEGLTWPCSGMVGTRRLACHDVRIFGRQYVPVWLAFLRRAIGEGAFEF